MMKDRLKKICGHGVSVNQRFEDCSLYMYIVCGFMYYGYPCLERENMTLQRPKNYGIRQTNDRHTHV